MTYPCRAGCINKEYETLGGWKRHMTTIHGGYSDEQLADIAGASPPKEETAESRMADFAATLPTDGEAVPGLAETPEPSTATPSEPEQKRVRRIRATPKKAKRILSTIPEKFLIAQGIELDYDDKEGLQEAVEFLENIFGVEFEVPEEKITVRNRWLALLYPVFIILLIVGKHRLGLDLKLGETPRDAE